MSLNEDIQGPILGPSSQAEDVICGGDLTDNYFLILLPSFSHHLCLRVKFLPGPKIQMHS
jgi:hypothetical protein